MPALLVLLLRWNQRGAEAQVVEPVARVAAGPVGRAAVGGVVVPRAASGHAGDAR